MIVCNNSSSVTTTCLGQILRRCSHPAAMTTIELSWKARKAATLAATVDYIRQKTGDHSACRRRHCDNGQSPSLSQWTKLHDRPRTADQRCPRRWKSQPLRPGYQCLSRWTPCRPPPPPHQRSTRHAINNGELQRCPQPSTTPFLPTTLSGNRAVCKPCCPVNMRGTPLGKNAFLIRDSLLRWGRRVRCRCQPPEVRGCCRCQPPTVLL